MDFTMKRTITDNEIIVPFLHDEKNASAKFWVGQYFFVYAFVWGQ